MTTPVKTENLKIYVEVDNNPKRAKAAKRFEFYRDGMTPSEYAERVGDKVQAYRDLTWDLEHGYIRLAGSSNDNHNSQ